jgi:cytochrome c oxidase subunit 1
MFIGFNLTFGPQHFLGVDGMPRRIFTYPSNMGWDLWNLVSTLGAYTLGLAILVFMVNAAISLKRGVVAGPDPWDAMTLEWTTSSPPAHFNFAEIPQVRARDELWARKYPQLAGHGGASAQTLPRVAVVVAEHDEHVHVHLPDPSYWPLVAASGLLVAGTGILMAAASGYAYLGVTAAGLFILMVGIYGWSLEPVNG